MPNNSEQREYTYIREHTIYTLLYDFFPHMSYIMCRPYPTEQNISSTVRVKQAMVRIDQVLASSMRKCQRGYVHRQRGVNERLVQPRWHQDCQVRKWLMSSHLRLRKSWPGDEQNEKESTRSNARANLLV
jgi:hypothetical protein